MFPDSSSTTQTSLWGGPWKIPFQQPQLIEIDFEKRIIEENTGWIKKIAKVK